MDTPSASSGYSRDGSSAHLLESPVDSLVMPVSCCYGQVKSELIRIAACLLYVVPSDLVDDYPQKNYSASRVAGMMEKPQETAKMLAYQLRQIADSIKA